MSGANAISGISVVGALLEQRGYQGGDTLVSGLLAFVTGVLAMINVVGGFCGHQSHAEHDRWQEGGRDGEWIPLGYLLSAALFIFGLKSSDIQEQLPVETNTSAMGMLVAV